MARPSHFRTGDVARADFRASREADALNTTLQRSLELQYRYQPARMAIGYSLGKAEAPAPAPDLLGRPIRGDTLFGQDEADVALWASLVVEHHGEGLSRKELQELVAAHWCRGLLLLRTEMARSGEDGPAMLVRLAAETQTR